MTGRHVSRSPEETRRLAAAFVRSLEGGAVVRLFGDLGAGKTCFVQGMAEALGWEGAVTSPTYALVREYETEPPLVHADLYRLMDPEGVWELELEEAMDAGALVAVEWSERAPRFWPSDAWEVCFSASSEAMERREITIERGGSDV